MTNKYVNRAKIDEKKFREITRYFSLDLTAIQVAELSGLNRNTVNRYLSEMRRKILIHSISTSPFKPIPKINDIGRYKYQALLLTEDNHRIYTDLLQSHQLYHNLTDCLNENYIPSHVNAAVLLKNYEFIAIMKPNESGIRDSAKLNRIKSFWGNSKSRLSKFKGMHSSTLILHIKECEFRYNNRNKDLFEILLRIFRNDPLF